MVLHPCALGARRHGEAQPASARLAEPLRDPRARPSCASSSSRARAGARAARPRRGRGAARAGTTAARSGSRRCRSPAASGRAAARRRARDTPPPTTRRRSTRCRGSGRRDRRRVRGSSRGRDYSVAPEESKVDAAIMDWSAPGEAATPPRAARLRRRIHFRGPQPLFPLVLASQITGRIQLYTAIAIAFARNPMTLANIGWASRRSRRALPARARHAVRPHIESASRCRGRDPPRACARWCSRSARSVAAGRGRAADFRGEFHQSHAHDPAARPSRRQNPPNPASSSHHAQVAPRGASSSPPATA